MRYLTFQLKNWRDVNKLVRFNYFLIATEEKSGYSHVRLLYDSQGYFKLCWGVYIKVCKIIPPGLKASPYIYKTIGMIVTSYFGVCHYSDDRLASKQL